MTAIADQLDASHHSAITKLRAEWAHLMKQEDCPEKRISIDWLLDRANALGIGRMDRP